MAGIGLLCAFLVLVAGSYAASPERAAGRSWSDHNGHRNVPRGADTVNIVHDATEFVLLEEGVAPENGPGAMLLHSCSDFTDMRETISS